MLINSPTNARSQIVSELTDCKFFLGWGEPEAEMTVAEQVLGCVPHSGRAPSARSAASSCAL